MRTPPAIICCKSLHNYVAMNPARATSFRPSGPQCRDPSARLARLLHCRIKCNPHLLLLCPPVFFLFFFSYTTQALCARMRLNGNRQPQFELTSGIRLTGDPTPVSRPGNQTHRLFTRLKLVQCRLLVGKLLVMSSVLLFFFFFGTQTE